jgi:hypothetical protein
MEWHDLETLKQSIELLDRKIELLFRHCGLVFEEGDRPRYLIDAEEHLRSGRDFEALKLIREQDAIGMVEAREVVDSMKQQLGLLTAPTESREAVSAFAANPAVGVNPAVAPSPFPAYDAKLDANGPRSYPVMLTDPASLQTAESAIDMASDPAIDPAIEEWKASAEQWKDAIEGWNATDPTETIVYDPDDEEDQVMEQKPAAWRPNVNNGLGKYFRKQRFEE